MKSSDELLYWTKESVEKRESVNGKSISLLLTEKARAAKKTKKKKVESKFLLFFSCQNILSNLVTQTLRQGENFDEQKDCCSLAEAHEVIDWI